MAPTKNVKISETQKEAMLEFMIVHSEFAANRLVGPLGKQKCKEMWFQLANELNSMGNGATKDVSKWKTSWSDWKLHVKSKASAISLYTRGTAGGTAPVTKLTPIEEKMLAWLGAEIVHGDLLIAEAGFPAGTEFTFENVSLSQYSSHEELPSTLASDVIIEEVLFESFLHVHESDIATTSHTTDTELLSPCTPVHQGSKRKSDAPSVSSKKSNKGPVNETAYDRAAQSFKSIEDEKIGILRDIRDSLANLTRAAETSASAALRQAVAVERIAAAKEKKYCN